MNGEGGGRAPLSPHFFFSFFFFSFFLPSPPRLHTWKGGGLGKIGEKGVGRGLGEEGWAEKGPGRPVYQETICIDLNLQLPSSVNVCLEKGN